MNWLFAIPGPQHISRFVTMHANDESKEARQTYQSNGSVRTV